jgi:uncharacterized lipoprotein YajG
MKRTYQIALAGLALLALLIQGCTLKTQNLHLDPAIDAAVQPITSDTLIGLEVVDARPWKKLGEVGDPNKGMVDVVLDEDFTVLVRDRLEEVLESRGFDVVLGSGAMTRSLTVAINSLELNSVKRPFDFETELNAEVFASAGNADATYDRTYYVRIRKLTAGPPYERHSNELVNDAVSKALSDLVNDANLSEMLVR